MNKNISKFLKENRLEFDKFFGIKLALPNIRLIADRRAFNNYWNKKTEDWMVGWTKENTIFILNPKNYTKESSHKTITSFWQVLKHEHAHCYFKKITNTNYPKWLNEGLACYLSKQVKLQPMPREALKVFDYFSKNGTQNYKLGYFWVKLLIEKFGTEKFIKLIKTLSDKTTEKQFGRNFYNIYKFRYSKDDFKKVIKRSI